MDPEHFYEDPDQAPDQTKIEKIKNKNLDSFTLNKKKYVIFQ